MEEIVNGVPPHGKSFKLVILQEFDRIKLELFFSLKLGSSVDTVEVFEHDDKRVKKTTNNNEVGEKIFVVRILRATFLFNGGREQFIK